MGILTYFLVGEPVEPLYHLGTDLPVAVETGYPRAKEEAEKKQYGLGITATIILLLVLMRRESINLIQISCQGVHIPSDPKCTAYADVYNCGKIYC